MNLVGITNALCGDLDRLRIRRPIAYVYNPLAYAWEPHLRYLRAYGAGRREVLLLGMNPGPWGMAQTGVPFGEVTLVRDWLGIQGRVDRPKSEHPRVPVRGFDCPRREVSGTRLWGWARETFKTPKRFFRQFFVANYCPLMFLGADGRNITPDRLPSPQRQPLLAVCDRALRRLVETMVPRIVIGVGGFAESRAKIALAGLDVTVGRILHPSPASPAANRGWAAQIEKQLTALGVKLPDAG